MYHRFCLLVVSWLDRGIQSNDWFEDITLPPANMSLQSMAIYTITCVSGFTTS